jgi:ribose 5-phosphate isomerase A
VNDLGSFDLPVEVVKFGWETTKRLIENVLIDQDVDCRIVTRRKNASPVITDENHYILDLKLNRIGNPEKLSQSLLNIAGVVETGLFLNMTDSIIMGDATGLARVKSNGASEWDDTNYDIKELSEFIANIKNI